MLENDKEIEKALNEAKESRSKDQYTIPSTIEIEKKINLFMRCNDLLSFFGK